MLWALVAAAAALSPPPPEDPHSVTDLVLSVAEEYLGSRCMAFLFPINFSSPNLRDVPFLVRSEILPRLHQKWAPYLPAVNHPEPPQALVPPSPGALNHLRCAHIIVLGLRSPLIDQIDKVMYTFYSDYYRDGAGEETRMVVVTDGDVDEAKVHELLFHMYKMGDANVIFLAKREDVVRVLTLFPFGRDGKSCPERGSKMETLDVWSGGAMAYGNNLFPDKIPRRFNSCLLNVSTVHYPPFIFLDANNETYDGVEYRILNAMCPYLGLRVNYTSYRRKDGWLWEENGRLFGSIPDLRRGAAWLTVSGVSNNIFNFPCIFVPHSYMGTELSWFFQDPLEVPTWKLIYVGFSLTMWLVVIFTLVLFPCVLYVVGTLEGKSEILRRLSTCVIISWSIAVGSSSSALPKTLALRLVMAAWLLYTMHVNLAYTASLTGLIMTGKMEPKVTTFEQMEKGNIKTVVQIYLTSQFIYMDEPVVKKVLSNFVLVSSRKKVFAAMEDFRNMSILEVDVFMYFKIKKYKLDFYKSSLRLYYNLVGISLRRNHFFGQRITRLSSRIFESGLAPKIVKDFTEAYRKESTAMKLKTIELNDLTGSFFLLVIGYVLACITIIAETCISLHEKHFRSKKKR